MLQRILELPRWILAGLSSILLIFLMIYSNLQGSKFQNELTYILKNPIDQQQHEINLGFLKIDKVDANDIFGHDFQRVYHLINESSIRIREGETYSIIGTTMSSGKIKIQKVQLHPYRFYKYLISGSAILLLLYLIFKNIRIQKRGIYLTLIQENDL